MKTERLYYNRSIPSRVRRRLHALEGRERRLDHVVLNGPAL